MKWKPSRRQLRNLAGLLGLLFAFAGLSLVAGEALLGEGATVALPPVVEAPALAEASPSAVATFQPTQTPTVPPEANAATTVWLPQSGSRYHLLPTCSGMQNPRESTLEAAIAEGFTPCKRCVPGAE